MSKNDAAVVHCLPSLLEPLFDLSHDGVQEGFHVTPNSSRGVANGNEGCVYRINTVVNDKCGGAYQRIVHLVCQAE